MNSTKYVCSPSYPCQTCGRVHVDHPSWQGLLEGTADDGGPHYGQREVPSLFSQELLRHGLGEVAHVGALGLLYHLLFR